MPLQYRIPHLGQETNYSNIFGNTKERFPYCEVTTVLSVSSEGFHLLHFKRVKLTIIIKNFLYKTKEITFYSGL